MVVYIPGIGIYPCRVPQDQLRWIPNAVANLVTSHGVADRRDLAKTLGLGRSTIYNAFDENWCGRVTTTVLYALARQFGVPMAAIVVEPMTDNQRKTKKTA